jgi:uncharacterized OsmC-like protein
MRVEVARDAGVRFTARVGRHEIVYDQPREAGGTDAGPTPTEAFVASLAGCVAYYAERFLERHGRSADGLRVTADFAMAEHPARVESVTLSVIVPELLPDTLEAALHAVVTHCTVHNSIRSAPEISIEIGAPVIAAR